jgi:hypothetical protein
MSIVEWITVGSIPGFLSCTLAMATGWLVTQTISRRRYPYPEGRSDRTCRRIDS